MIAMKDLALLPGEAARSSLILSGEMAQELILERSFTAALLDTASSLIVVLDREGRIVRFNHACEQVSGYQFAEVKGQEFWNIFLSSKEAPEVKAVFADLRAGHFPNQHENDWLMKDGEARRIAWSNTALLDGNAQVQYVIGIGTDITERRTAEMKLSQRERMLEHIYSRVNTGICVIDEEGRFARVNHAYADLYGWGEEDLIGQPFNILMPATVAERAALGFQQLLGSSDGEDKSLFWEWQMVRKDGTSIDVQIANAWMICEEGQRYVVATASDVTERKRQERHLLHLSMHDHLTGLPNRRALEEKLMEVIDTASPQQHGALFFIDLDGFKRINDTAPKGHAAGDEALLWVADVLSQKLRNGDMLARLGGDEFAVLLPRTPVGVANKMAERLRMAIAAEPFVTDGHAYQLRLSMGLVAIAGQVSAHTVLIEADRAMYLAKRQGGDRVVAFGVLG